MSRLWSHDAAAGYGQTDGNDRLALIKQSEPVRGPGPGFHLAFAGAKPWGRRRISPAALANGGRDAGPPGPRPHYGERYYAAFVFDPDGHKLEAVHQ